MAGKKMLGLSMALLMALFLLGISQINAQVTFSKDWNAGKRSAPSDCAASIKSASSICQMLLTELRTAASCEVRSLFRLAEEPPEAQEIFSRSG